jgi:hypothetical protein
MDATRNKMFLAGTLLGVIYGVFAFFIFRDRPDGLMTASFLALVPAALGFLPYVFVDEAQVRHFRRAAFLPIVIALGSLGVAWVAHSMMDGIWLLCIVAIWAPSSILLGLLWWFFGALWLWRRARQHRAWAAIALMVLPFVTAAYEQPAKATTVFEIKRAAVVRAPAQVVEQLVEHDPEIALVLEGFRLERGLGAWGFETVIIDPKVERLSRDGQPPRTRLTLAATHAGETPNAYARLVTGFVLARSEERLLSDLTRRAEMSARASTVPAP